MHQQATVLWCRVFNLAKERDLDLDFHVDENGNEQAKGLLYIARKTLQHGYEGRVVCGHCWHVPFQLHAFGSSHCEFHGSPM